MAFAIAPLSYAAIIAELGFTPADDSDLSAHIADTGNPHSVTKSQVGLGNVENTALSTWAGSANLVTVGNINAGVWNGTAIADAYIASAATWNAKQAALGFTPENVANKATNFVTVSDTLYPSVQAVKAYADALVVGLLDDRGNFDASGNVFPSSGGSGTAGAILKGDLWLISVAGTLGGTAVAIGDQIRAITDAPGQTAGNWAISEANIGYVSENVANKATSFSTLNNTLYPTTQAVANYAQPLSSNLTTYASIAPSSNVQTLLGAANYAAFKTSLSLNNVENTALSTWAGSANITTLGTVTSGGLGTGASLGGVTMSLGSDANGDIYYRASGVLTRLAKGTALQQLRMNAGATAPEWATITSSGATTALDNLASVAINQPLTTAAGTAAALTATAPTQTTGAQAGIAASLTASAAVAGSSTAGAANGGSVTITAGAAARLTSGNGNGGDINLVPGALIGSGNNGAVIMTDDRQFVAAAKGSSVATTPSITFKGNLTTGWNGNAANNIITIANGTATMSDVNIEHRYLSSLIVGWTSGAVTATSLDTAMARSAARMIEVNNGTVGQFGDLKIRQLYVDQTITAGGTTGNQTINKAFGTVNIAASGSSVTVTNSLCTTNSTVFAVIRTNDSTARIINVVPQAGSFVINVVPPTGEISVAFHVINL